MARGEQGENPNQPLSSLKVSEKRICVYCGHITSDRLKLLSLSCCPDVWRHEKLPLRAISYQVTQKLKRATSLE